MNEVVVTVEEAISELKREITMRERLYPTWVSRGTLKREDARRQIGRAKAALHILMDVQENEPPTASVRRLRREEVSL